MEQIQDKDKQELKDTMWDRGVNEKVNIEHVDFFVTEQCNLKCTYCFHKQTPATMSVEDGKKVLDRLKELYPDYMAITFFGGEPMLYPDRVLEWATYAKQLWPDKVKDNKTIVGTELHVCSNGTYFDEEMFKKYKELGISFQLSFDGDRVTMQECRGGDFDKIVENLKNIVRIMPETSIRMTYTPNTVGRLSINIPFIHSLGFSDIMHHAVMEADWTKEAVETYAYQLSQIYRYRRWALKRGLKLHIMFIDKPLHVVNDEIPIDPHFCAAGRTYLAILPGGDVYPCHRAASNRLFKLGNIFEKRPFIRGIFLALSKGYVGCTQRCPASDTCHTCVLTHYLINGDLTKVNEKYCAICKIENLAAHNFLPVEINDNRDRKLDALCRVVADLAEENMVFKDAIIKYEEVKEKDNGKV